MKINGKPYTSIWYSFQEDKILYIDQNYLPWKLVIKEMQTIEDAIRAIKDMEVRGAPLIGVAAAFGVSLAGPRAKGQRPKEGSRAKGRAKGQRPKAKGRAKGQRPKDEIVELREARPTAVNLQWAVDRMEGLINENRKLIIDQRESISENRKSILSLALEIRREEIDRCRAIGEHGVSLIRDIYERTHRPVQVMTHCNAGWLACVEWGTATAPIYVAQQEGIPVHVWVSETRPRNQGARLTQFELQEQGVPNTLIVDSAAGHLMQEGKVDLVITGADRIARNGDTANKIGTYMKAIAAKAHDIPFWVAAPSSTFDPLIASGKEIPIEERSAEEVWSRESPTSRGKPGDGRIGEVFNPGFDITPRRLVTGFVTEDGVLK